MATFLLLRLFAGSGGPVPDRGGRDHAVARRLNRIKRFLPAIEATSGGDPGRDRHRARHRLLHAHRRLLLPVRQAAEPVSAMRSCSFWLSLAVVVALDQVTKHVVATTFAPGESRIVDPAPAVVDVRAEPRRRVRHVRLERGAGCSSLWRSRVLGLFWYAFRDVATRSRLVRIAFGAIVGGAIGNIADRFHYGYVVDFIDLRWWPVFNVADSCITIGVALLILATFSRERALARAEAIAPAHVVADGRSGPALRRRRRARRRRTAFARRGGAAQPGASCSTASRPRRARRSSPATRSTSNSRRPCRRSKRAPRRFPLDDRLRGRRHRSSSTRRPGW